METVRLWAHYTFNGYNNWCKCSLLHLHNPRIILPLLFVFVVSEYSLKRFVYLTGAVGVGDSDVKKGILALSPETFCADIESSVLSHIRGSVKYMPFDRLKGWLDLHVVTNFLQKMGFEVSDAVMPGVNKTAPMTVHCVCDGKGLGTWAPGWHAFYGLIVS